MKKLRTALVGCGKIGHTHAEALRDLPQSELVAVCDRDLRRSESFASQYGGRPFGDVGVMLREAGVGALLIATPHPLHAEAAIAAAEAGAHVLVEKPLAATLADCDAMLEAARKAGTKLGVISQRRFVEPVQRMKAAIDAGKIGQPILGTVVMLSWRDRAYYASDPWRGKWDAEGGGVLVNQSPHHLDLLRWMMGPIEEISGCWANLSHPYVEVEDTALATIRFRSGGLGSIVVSLCQKPGIYTKIQVHGSNGASVGVQTDSGATFVAGMTEAAEPPFNDLWTIPGEEGLLERFRVEDRERGAHINQLTHYHRMQIDEFLQAVAAGREPAVSGEDGRAVVEMFTAIYRSNKERRPVKLPLQ